MRCALHWFISVTTGCVLISLPRFDVTHLSSSSSSSSTDCLNLGPCIHSILPTIKKFPACWYSPHRSIPSRTMVSRIYFFFFILNNDTPKVFGYKCACRLILLWCFFFKAARAAFLCLKWRKARNIATTWRREKIYYCLFVFLYIYFSKVMQRMPHLKI